MEIFNLNKYLTGEYLVYTDSGIKVDIIDYPGKSGILGDNSVLGKVRSANSWSYSIVEFDLDGNIKSLLPDNNVKIKNLVMYESVVKWFNIRLSYSGAGLESSMPYDTENNALLHRLPSDLDTIKVVYSPEKCVGPSLNQLDNLGVSGICETKDFSIHLSDRIEYQVNDPKHLPEVKYYNSLGEDISDVKDIMSTNEFLTLKSDPILISLIEIVAEENDKKELPNIPDNDIEHIIEPLSELIIASSTPESLMSVSDKMADPMKFIKLGASINKEVRRGIYLGFVDSYPDLMKYANDKNVLLDKYVLHKIMNKKSK